MTPTIKVIGGYQTKVQRMGAIGFSPKIKNKNEYENEIRKSKFASTREVLSLFFQQNNLKSV